MMMSQLLGFLERRITKQNLEKSVVFFCNTFDDERKFVSFCCITAFGSGISVSLDKKGTRRNFPFCVPKIHWHCQCLSPFFCLFLRIETLLVRKSCAHFDRCQWSFLFLLDEEGCCSKKVLFWSSFLSLFLSLRVFILCHVLLESKSLQREKGLRVSYSFTWEFTSEQAYPRLQERHPLYTFETPIPVIVVVLCSLTSFETPTLYSVVPQAVRYYYFSVISQSMPSIRI